MLLEEASGPSSAVREIVSAGKDGITWMTDLFSHNISEENVSVD